MCEAPGFFLRSLRAVPTKRYGVDRLGDLSVSAQVPGAGARIMKALRHVAEFPVRKKIGLGVFKKEMVQPLDNKYWRREISQW
jgi:hypothetical protein